MATEKIPSWALDTLSAAANLTGKETYLGVNSAGLAALAAGATAPLFLIYQGGAQGRPVSCAHSGLGRVTLGGTVAAGDKITSNGSGLGITTTTTGNHFLGVAREAGVSGQVISVRLEPGVI
jgi:hypothetical protein